ncbi:uncharacterized mitochondrial protein-like protein [Tanacetum coccineum]
MEYLVNISKRRALWSLNEDFLKITILKTNTPYPSRKIRRIRAYTHQRPQRNKAQYAISRRPIHKMIEDIPIDANVKYTLTDGDPLLDPTLYRTIVVSSGYSVQTLLFSSMSTLNLCAYCDSDWVGDSISRKLTTGFCIFLGDSLISWKNMGVPISHFAPLHCDNHSPIQIACNSMFHERTKYIEIDCHFTRHHLQVETISLLFVPSALHIADVFTKPLWIVYLFSD